MRSPGSFGVLALALSLSACGGKDGDAPLSPTPPATVDPRDTMSLRSLVKSRGLRIGIGGALGSLFGSTDPASARYTALFAREYDVLTPENDLKFSSVQPTRGVFRFARPDSMVAFARANGMRVRGHTLAWHNQVPAWLTAGQWSKAEAKALLDEHIVAVAGHYKGQLAAWDVVNEAFNDGTATLRPGFWSDHIGREYIEQAFRTTRAVDPTVPLFYNDYGIEGINAKSDSVFALLRDFRARGVPLDGVGMQMHLVAGQVPSTLAQNFARFAALGLKIHVTELDVRVPTPASGAALQTQAQSYREVFSVCLDSPACEMVVMWGLTDRASWVPATFPGQGEPLLFDATFGKKPAYDLVHALLAGR